MIYFSFDLNILHLIPRSFEKCLFLLPFLHLGGETLCLLRHLLSNDLPWVYRNWHLGLWLKCGIAWEAQTGANLALKCDLLAHNVYFKSINPVTKSTGPVSCIDPTQSNRPLSQSVSANQQQWRHSIPCNTSYILITSLCDWLRWTWFKVMELLMHYYVLPFDNFSMFRFFSSHPE